MTMSSLLPCDTDNVCRFKCASLSAGMLMFVSSYKMSLFAPYLFSHHEDTRVTSCWHGMTYQMPNRTGTVSMGGYAIYLRTAYTCTGELWPYGLF
jgi:hypothetical protein